MTPDTREKNEYSDSRKINFGGEEVQRKRSSNHVTVDTRLYDDDDYLSRFVGFIFRGAKPTTTLYEVEF